MPRNLRVRPNPTMSFMGGILGLIFVIIGVTVAIPQIGGFGFVWTLVALIGTIMSFYNAFSTRGIATEVIEVPDDISAQAPSPKDLETRFRRLDDLKTKGLITPAEYERKRSNILSDL